MYGWFNCTSANNTHNVTSLSRRPTTTTQTHTLHITSQIDTLPEAIRPKAIKKATKLLHQTLAVTKFGKAPVIPVAAKPGMCWWVDGWVGRPWAGREGREGMHAQARGS